MRVILHRNYKCAPEGHTTLRFNSGEELTGKAALMALEDDAGFTPVEETKPAAKLETKATRKKGKKK